MTAADCPPGKRRYATELAARRALRAIRRSRRAALPGHERRAYLCRLCNNWHLTGHRNEFARLAASRAARDAGRPRPRGRRLDLDRP